MIVDEYAEVNNFGTTRVPRAFAPLLRDNARIIVVASSLDTLYYLAPVLHDQFDNLASLDEVDKQVAAWRDAVRMAAPAPAPGPGSSTSRPRSARPAVRHRLNRGGDRALNRAIHTIALTRMRSCARTRDAHSRPPWPLDNT